MTSLLARIGAFFIDPPEPLPDPPPPRSPNFLPPSAARADAGSSRSPTSASCPVADLGGQARPAADAAADLGAPAPTAARSDVGPTWQAPTAPSRGSTDRGALVSATRSDAGPAWQAPTAPVGAATSSAGRAGAGASAAWSGAATAAVLGAPAVAIPVAAACAGELRARSKAAAALLCVWRPAKSWSRTAAADPTAPAAEPPAGATTPGARRLAARLSAHDLPASACGRLAWLALDRDPETAAEQVLRALSVAGAPVVLAVAGARPPAFEPLLAEVDLAVAVLPADIDPALRELALGTLRARERAVLPPLPPGPPRWAAMAGLARLRSLPRGAS